MKKILPLIIIFALVSTPALAGERFPYLTTALVKTFHSMENYPGKEVEVIRILIHTQKIRRPDPGECKRLIRRIRI